MRVQVGPRWNDAAARYESEGRLHADNTAELRRDSVGAAIIGSKCGERNSARDRHRRASARAAGRLGGGGIIRISYLPGERACAVPMIRKVVRDGFAEHDCTGGAHPR